MRLLNLVKLASQLKNSDISNVCNINFGRIENSISEVKTDIDTLLAKPTITTDANGWTIYNYGTHKQYRKKGSITESLTASQWKYSTNTVSLPVGMSTVGTNFVEGSVITSDSAITVQIANTNALTGINFAMTNQYGSAINNFTLYYSLCLTTTS